MRMGAFARRVFRQKYALPGETWEGCVNRVCTAVVGCESEVFRPIRRAMEQRQFIPAGRYLYASGRRIHNVQNCLCLRAEDSREGWADLTWKAAMALMLGAGIGVVYSDVREEGCAIHGTGGTATGPVALMQIINELGRSVMQGGSRRSALWAGLGWDHPDVMKFVRSKDWTAEQRVAKARDYSAYAPLDMTNISVVLDDGFFRAYSMDGHPLHVHAVEVFQTVVRRMMKTGEPGFTVTWGDGLDLRNACCEFLSSDDSDLCNLGSINLGRVDTIEQFAVLVELGTRFLLSGGCYTTFPYPRAEIVCKRNRNIGLGLMGMHEWLLRRGHRYAPCEELGRWLEVYRDVSDRVAAEHAERLGVAVPVRKRAIAPTGTIGIIAECGGTGIEPIFCAAYKRRFLDGKTWKMQYVVDPAVKRLLAEGVPPDLIEDALSLAGDWRRRMEFQSWVQEYVDHGISSTINLPAWGTPGNNSSRVEEFGRDLMEFLPRLRGITVYPDGGRGGQPLSRVPVEEAVRYEGIVVEESGSVCDLRGGSCGD